MDDTQLHRLISTVDYVTDCRFWNPAFQIKAAIVGCISSVISLLQFSTNEGEANFGKVDDPYAVTTDRLLVLLDVEWTIFELMEAESLNESEEIVLYNGKEYLKSELCDATLHWLELSEEERMLSSYMPPEFMIFEETWGITLAAEKITSTKCDNQMYTI